MTVGRAGKHRRTVPTVGPGSAPTPGLVRAALTVVALAMVGAVLAVVVLR